MKKKHKDVEKINVEKQLAYFSKSSKEEILKKYNVGLNGLSRRQVEYRLDEYGKNIIDIQSHNRLIKRIRQAIINPFNLVLVFVAVVTYITDVVLSTTPSYATFLMLLSIVLISGIISFIQQEKSNNAAKKLQKMITNKIDVIRGGKQEEIEIEDAVPGDIVKLFSGDMIPGDVRFLETKDLFIDQSQLTGESNPVEKFQNNEDFNDITGLKNIGFMGSNVISGSAIALILTTGNRTYFGSMAKSLYTDEEKSSFEKGIDSVSKLLIKFMLVILPIIFIANFLTKDDWLESLVFGITIAVALMPEMLPVIMTSSLAKGAVGMSKKKTIVKRLGSIQTFGEMDILCTDKTGTLTQDKIILEKYMDATGKLDLRILKHAFLNSYFQTGMKDLIDVAVINRAEKENMNFLKSEYEKEDEIPFDFSRRRMSVILKDKSGKRQLITKGAFDEILSICKFIEIDGNVQLLDEKLIKNAKEVYGENSKDGLRIVAVAQKNDINGINNFEVQDEKDMVLLGFIGFLDPPKESAKSAIETLKKYNIKTIILTGDSEGVALNVCSKLGVPIQNTLTGSQLEMMTDEELKTKCENCYIFSKLTPFQKKRIVKILQQNGHTVGYMGDGINDAPPLKQADVGISVDSAVDIAKEVADIILLEKDLDVLGDGVIEGRKTFANIIKYLKMATSGNFGNMISVMISSIFLPFLPLLPIHILIQNILTDFAQLGMPFDNVEKEYILKPKKWNINSLKNFMFLFGLLSSIIDIMCFGVLLFVLKFNTVEQSVFFQCGYFLFGTISQVLVIHTMRTHKLPFIESRASKQLSISTLLVILVAIIIGFTSFSRFFELKPMFSNYIIYLIGLNIIYLCFAQILKKIYIKKYNQWI